MRGVMGQVDTLSAKVENAMLVAEDRGGVGAAAGAGAGVAVAADPPAREMDLRRRRVPVSALLAEWQKHHTGEMVL